MGRASATTGAVCGVSYCLYSCTGSRRTKFVSFLNQRRHDFRDQFNRLVVDTVHQHHATDPYARTRANSPWRRYSADPLVVPAVPIRRS